MKTSREKQTLDRMKKSRPWAEEEERTKKTLGKILNDEE